MGMLQTIAEDNRKFGKAEGKAEGLAEGKDEKTTEVARAMIANGEPIEKIVLYTGLSLEVIEQIKHGSE